MPRSEDRGTIAGLANIAGLNVAFSSEVGTGSREENASKIDLRVSGGRCGRRMKLQRKTVHAVAQAGRLRAVVEHVAEMAAATAAMDLGAPHAQGAVVGLA